MSETTPRYDIVTDMPNLQDQPEDIIRQTARRIGREVGERVQKRLDTQEFRIGSQALLPLNIANAAEAEVLHYHGLLDDATLRKIKKPKPTDGRGITITM